METASNLDRHFLLSDILAEDSDFTIRVIDTPPNAGICSIAALVTATHVVCPVATEPAAWEQMRAFEELIGQVKRRMNPHLEWLGIIPTRYDSRNNLDREVLAALKAKYGVLCFSPIRASVKWRESMTSLAPPWAQPLSDYLVVTNEILGRLGYEEITS
jgi:cellulose biosynthesis protein BcsQ